MAWQDLFEGTPPAAMTSTAVTQQGLPAWYQELTRGVAAKGLNEADWRTDTMRNNPYPDQRIADFQTDQVSGFDTVRQNQNAWQAPMQGAMGAAGNIANAVNPYLAQGNTAVGGLQAAAGQNWPTNYAQYMNPYMSQVTDEIARLGNRNFQENLMPQIDSSFVGAGQYGSTRNADIMGRAMRDTQRDITGQQSQALQQGWNTSANIFNQDQGRNIQAMQQSGALASNLGTLASGAQETQAARQGALAGQVQNQYGTQAGQLGVIGQQQQDLQQRYLDQNYNDYVEQRDAGMNNLAWANQLTRGMQLPTAATQTVSQQGGASGPSPLASLAAAGAAYRGATTNKG